MRGMLRRSAIGGKCFLRSVLRHAQKYLANTVVLPERTATVSFVVGMVLALLREVTMDQLKMLKLLRRDTSSRMSYLFEITLWDVCLALRVDNELFTRMRDIEDKVCDALDAHRKLVEEMVAVIDAKIAELEQMPMAPVVPEVTE